MKVTRRESLRLTLANAALAAVASPLRAAPPPDGPEVKTLDIVFEGGGIKGAAFCGALGVLEARGYTYRHLIGTSAGAITAVLLAAGYQSADIHAILTKRDKRGRNVFNTFLLPPEEVPDGDTFEGNPKVLEQAKAAGEKATRSWRDRLSASTLETIISIKDGAKGMTSTSRIRWYQMQSLVTAGAIASDAFFIAWLCKQLNDSPLLKGKLATPEQVASFTLASFDGLSRASGVQLSVVATDLTGIKSLVLNHHTAPGVPLVAAIRMSMGIPMVWPEVEWKKEWGTYRNSEMIEKVLDDQEKPTFDGHGHPILDGHRIVDGGVLSNFPLKYLIDPRHMTEGEVLGKPARVIETRILGLLLDETEDIDGINKVVEKKHLAERLPAYQSLNRVLSAMSGAADQEAIDDSKRPEIVVRGLGAEGPLCRIPVKGYQTLDFNMDDGRMAILIKSGKKKMEDYLGNPARPPTR